MLWRSSAEPQRLMPCGKPGLSTFGTIPAYRVDEQHNLGRWRM